MMRRQSANTVEAYELMPIIRKVQVIDVREEPEFRAKHILGARNIPYSQFGQRFQEIRRDKPVYLYGDGNYTLSRAAHVLKKNHYNKENINILKGGMEEWPGKVKTQL
ncbi:rhodanese-like domain-containing protein [Aerococcaceae bacterium DSM 111020]|nr:rhodanese-like domain-containing protein [Aerococcaceae bacterium DSM 111020]